MQVQSSIQFITLSMNLRCHKQCHNAAILLHHCPGALVSYPARSRLATILTSTTPTAPTPTPTPAPVELTTKLVLFFRDQLKELILPFLPLLFSSLLFSSPPSLPPSLSLHVCFSLSGAHWRQCCFFGRAFYQILENWTIKKVQWPNISGPKSSRFLTS